MAADLGPRIAQLRLDLGFSQEALASELCVSRQAVSRWECGETLPDTENLIALAELFGVTLDELVKGSVPASVPEPVAAPEPSPAAAQTQRPLWLKRVGISLIFAGIALIFIGSILRYIGNEPFGAESPSPATLKASIPIERTEDILDNDITAVDIAWPSGEVSIVAWPEDETDGTIRIHEDRFDPESEDALVWEIDSGTLRISADPSISYIGETSITIAIPYEALAHLSSVSAEVLDGSLCVQDIVSAALSVAMRNGVLQVANVDAAALTLEQGAGVAHVSGRFGNVDARVSGGAYATLAIENSDVTAIAAKVASGTLALQLPAEMGFALSRQIDGTGSVEVGFPIAYDEAGGHVGDESCAIDLHLGEGTVRIEPL